ncbi:hypothetical protein N9485_04700 [Luminiphilus sp.]|nr:hypothetical protein [Luminiphilus sp.]
MTDTTCRFIPNDCSQVTITAWGEIGNPDVQGPAPVAVCLTAARYLIAIHGPTPEQIGRAMGQHLDRSL